jgi:hypothetical protein
MIKKIGDFKNCDDAMPEKHKINAATHAVDG